MKKHLTFQNLILLALAPVLTAFAAFWAWQVYQSAHRLILAGFDRKLLTLATGTAAFIDGDAHAEYQRWHTIVAIAPTSAGTIGYDCNRNELSIIDIKTGAGHPLCSFPKVRCIAGQPRSGQVFGLSGDSASILVFDAKNPTQCRFLPAGGPADGLFVTATGLTGWHGTELFQVDTLSGAHTPLPQVLPEPMLSLAADLNGKQWYGLSADGHTLFLLNTDAKLIRKVEIYPFNDALNPSGEPVYVPPLALHAIAVVDGELFGADYSLTMIDSVSGKSVGVGPTNGYFDPDAPFYQRYRPIFMDLRKAAGLTFLYTQLYIGGNQLYYILDGSVAPLYSGPGALDNIPAASIEDEQLAQYLGRTLISPIQPWQTWGLLKSCSTPILDANGHIVAVVGADVDIGIIRSKTRWAAFAAIMIGVASLIAAGFVSFRVARSLTRPVQQIKEATLCIAAGQPGAQMKFSAPREVSFLAATLERLHDKLQGERQRVIAWRKGIREAREHTALAQTLESVFVHAGGTLDPKGGSCHRMADAVWWFIPGLEDALEKDATAVRHATLASELLASGKSHEKIPMHMLAADSKLGAVACWHEEAATLYYKTRYTVRLCTSTADRQLNGSGFLRFALCPTVRLTEDDQTSTPFKETIA